MPKIIILRGNSGSGKSSVAAALQKHLTPRPFLIEHDHFRRHILKEHDDANILNDELILHTIEFALRHNRHIILEGILPINHSHQKYKKLFDRILQIHPIENYFYWFDIPFEETLKRHSTRAKMHEFGKEEMQNWYKEDDRTRYAGEVIIPSSNSLDQTVGQILQQTGLA